MAEWDKMQKYRGMLKPDDFSDQDYRSCWEMFLASESTDDYFSKWVSNLETQKKLSECINSHWTELPHALLYMISEIRKSTMKLRIRHEVNETLRDGEGDEIIATLTRVADDEMERKRAGEGNSAIDLYESVCGSIETDDREKRLYTGIPDMDSIIDGLRQGNVSILGAEPSTGKTALALNIAAHNVKKGRKVLFFSLEMSREQLMQRMVAAEGSILYGKIGGCHLSAEEKQKFRNTALQLTGQGNVLIYDTIYAIEEMTEKIMAEKPDLVFVDFLQFCRTAVRFNNTADKLEYIVSEFKRIAKMEANTCHIMLLSQPGRSSGNEKQSMFTLKGSSAIEQGGDVIMMLDRPAVRDLTKPTEQANVKITKNKFGRTGSVDLYFEGEYQRFRALCKDGEAYSYAEKPDGPGWDGGDDRDDLF